MAPLHKMSREIELDTRALIRSITGFEDSSENFKLCMQFALSNFRYHKFLDVNSHQVQHKIDGLCEKLLIHSQDDKAHDLRSFTESFLQPYVKEERSVEETGYAVLSLLLQLCNSPTNNEYFKEVCLTQDTEIQESEKEFDWSSYLLEGDEKYSIPSDDSDEEDCEDDEEEEIISKDSKITLPQRDDSGIFISQDGSSGMYQSTVQTSLMAIQQPTGRAWLQQHLIDPYWNSQYEVALSDVASSTLSANLVKEWEQYLENCGVLYVHGRSIVLSERLIVREILWMLQGVKDLFLFSWNGKKFTVKKDVQLSHVTQNTLNTVLEHFCRCGDIVAHLKHFIHSRKVGKETYFVNCQTYQAYAASLLSTLSKFSEVIGKIEKQLIEQECAVTLGLLQHKLSPYFEELELLKAIHKEGIEDIPENCPTWNRAIRLLVVLYKHVMNYNMSLITNTKTSWVLKLFLKSCRPYLNLLEGLVSFGWLEDPYEEFVLQRKEAVNVLDENFWDRAITVHPVPSDLSADFFLQPLLPQVVLAGKSVEMLRRLGFLPEVMSTNKGNLSHSLYDQFLQNLESVLQERNTAKYVEKLSHLEADRGFYDGVDVSTSSDSSLKCDTPNIDQDFSEKVLDPLLKRNFTDLFNHNVVDNVMQKIPTVEQEDNIEFTSCCPINAAIQKALYPCINYRCHLTCQKLIDVLKDKHKLMVHMETFRKFFLMEAGDVLFAFYSEIFKKLCSSDHWQDVSFLNMALQDSMFWHNVDESFRLSVTLNSSTSSLEKKLSVLDSLQLVYTVPWPVNTVLSSASQNLYSQVFSFLLQVKCAKYALDELRFSDLSQRKQTDSEIMHSHIPREQKIHSMHLLRMRLMHFINSFHGYIMTRILHSTGIKLEQELQQAENLEQVIQTHNNYLDQLHKQCLLNTKLNFLREGVSRILNIAMTFQQHWQIGIDNTNIEELSQIEEEFGHCHQFLTSYLSRPAQRGTFPHLEALASTLLAHGTLVPLFNQL